MPSNDLIRGTLAQYDVPDWQPLRDLVGMDLADWFMWMHEIELEDGAAVHVYKHIATRRYFHLGVDGRAFAYTPRGLFREILPREAIDEAFEGWEELLHDEDPEPVRRELMRVRRVTTVRASRRAA